MKPRVKAGSALTALKYPRYRRIWLANGVSTVGDWMQITGRALLVFSITGKTSSLGLIYFVSYIPQLVLTPIGGVLADRFDRRRTLLTGQILATGFAATVGVLAMTRTATLGNIAAISLGAGIVQTMTLPAGMALIPQLIPADDLPSAMALSMTTNNAARVVGPLLAALVTSAWGVDWVFYLNAGSFLFVIVAWLVTPIRPPVIPADLTTWRGLVDGFDYVRRNASLVVPIALICVLSAVGLAYQVLGVAYAGKVLAHGSRARGDQYFGYFQAAIGTGGILGVLGLTRLGRGRPAATLFGTAAAFSTCLLLLGEMHSIAYALPLALLLGAFHFSNTNLALTLVQHEAPEEMRGRVMSIALVSMLGILPLTSLAFGPLADHFGIGATFAGAGVVCLAATLLLFRWRDAVGIADESVELRPQVALALASEEA